MIIEKVVLLIAYEQDFKVTAKNSTEFDSWINLDKQPRWCTIVNTQKTNKQIVPLKFYKALGKISANSKDHLQSLIFLCRMNHLFDSLVKLEETFD